MKEFDIFNKPEFVSKQIEKSWQILPPTQENAITRRAGGLWFKDSKQKSEGPEFRRCPAGLDPYLPRVLRKMPVRLQQLQVAVKIS